MSRLLIVAAVVLVYANSVRGPFILDDNASVVLNQSIRDLGRLTDVLAGPTDAPTSGRPLVNLSFALNYAVGGLDVVGYHAVNVALHAACALLLFGICRRTLSSLRGPASLDGSAARQRDAGPFETRSNTTVLALAAALLWAVHPLNSEVVDYVSQRTESMMALCYLATLYAGIRAHETGQRRWTLGAVAACALGMASKESMITAPMMVVLYDWTFLFGRAERGQRPEASWREALSKRRGLYAGLACTWLVLVPLVATAPRSAVAGFSAGVSIWTNLLNQAVLVVDYLKLAFWPHDLVVFYGWHVPLTLTDVLPQATLILMLVAATAAAVARAPAVGFLGAWFFVTLAPSSSLVPVVTEVGAERRMYLPLAALVVLVMFACAALWRRLGRGNGWRVGVVATGIATIALGAATFARNREYRSALRLASTVVERRPTAVAHQILGEQLTIAGRHAEAVPHFDAAVKGGDSRAGLVFGEALARAGDYDRALVALDAFLATEGKPLVPRWLEPRVPEVVGARLLTGRILLARKDADGAEAQAQAVLGRFPRHVEARQLLAQTRYQQQRWPEAVAEYRLYLASRPQDVESLLALGVAAVATGALDQAVAVFQRAAALDPKNERAARLLTFALRDQAAGAAGPRAGAR